MFPAALSLRRPLSTAAAFLLLAVSFGCSAPLQSSRQTNLYTLEYDLAEIPEFTTLKASLRLSSFDAAPEYQTANMAYREKEFTRGYYPYHKWLASPPQLVGYFIERDLTTTRLFESVLSSSSRLRPTYSLEGTVVDFLEIDRPDGWQAQLTVNILLQRMSKGKKDGATLMQHNYSVRSPCSKKTPQAVAAAMSAAMREVSLQIQKDIFRIVSTDMQNDESRK